MEDSRRGLGQLSKIRAAIRCCDDRLNPPFNAPIAQIDNGGAGLRGAFDVLHQDRRLLDLLGEGVAVVGIAGKGPGADDQVAFLGGGNAHLDPEFVRLAGLALADALDFRRVQGVELVLVLGPPGVDAPGPFGPHRGDLLHAVG